MSLRGLDSSRPFTIEVADRLPEAGLLALMRAERTEFEAVLGTTVDFAGTAPSDSPAWTVRLDHEAPAVRLQWDAATQRLTSVLRAGSEYGIGLDLLHTLAHSRQDVVADMAVEDPAAAVARIHDEVAAVFPSFGLRGLDWEAITARYADLPTLPWPEFVPRAKRWVAELGDAHTALSFAGSRYHPSYRATMTADGAVLTEVPVDTAAAESGVGAGWTIRVDDPAEWLATTGATPQQHAQVAARRFLAMSAHERSFTARSPQGDVAIWVEHAVPRPTVSVDPDAALIKLTGFADETPARVDEALSRLSTFDSVTVDLRGNAGGSLLSATEVRRRFLRGPTTIGTVRHSDGRGGLGEPRTVRAEPVERPWPGDVVFLVDAMTYSASEDLLWGLQGLPHVRLHGSATGGGSGRPHTRRITDDLTLRVSTALTFDRKGRCIELHGLRPDS